MKRKKKKSGYFFLIQGAASYGEKQKAADKAVECYIQNELVDNSIPLDEIIQETARILSGELLYMKFLQGYSHCGSGRGSL